VILREGAPGPGTAAQPLALEAFPQLIDQYEPGEMIFNRDFRGGPRSDDFIIFTVTEGIDSVEQAKQRFYKTLVDLLQKNPGVRGEDVFVKIYLTPPACPPPARDRSARARRRTASPRDGRQADREPAASLRTCRTT
jgi:hypothetical protein